MPTSQDVGTVVMLIIAKVHHKPRYVCGFVNYPRVFKGLFIVCNYFFHMSPLPVLHFSFHYPAQPVTQIFGHFCFFAV